MAERDFKGVWIPKQVWLDKKLTWIEKLFLVEIDSLDNEDGCYASNKYFSDFFGITSSRCSQIITSLKNKGYISAENIRDGKVITKRVLRILNTIESSKKGGKNIKHGSKNIKYGYLENDEENNTLFNNTNNNTNNTYEEIEEFLTAYNNISSLPKAIKLTETRKKHIQARIKEHGLETCIQALNKIKASDFLSGKNNQGWKPNLDWIVNQSNMIKILEGAYDNKKGGGDKKRAATIYDDDYYEGSV
jgi:hypothetical protein